MTPRRLSSNPQLVAALKALGSVEIQMLAEHDYCPYPAICIRAAVKAAMEWEPLERKRRPYRGNPELAKQMIAPCPFCQAPPGIPCHFPSGQMTAYSHAARCIASSELAFDNSMDKERP